MRLFTKLAAAAFVGIVALAGVAQAQDIKFFVSAPAAPAAPISRSAG